MTEELFGTRDVLNVLNVLNVFFPFHYFYCFKLFFLENVSKSKVLAQLRIDRSEQVSHIVVRV